MTTATPSFTCPRCGAVSYNPNDLREGYCGNCHDWTGAASVCFFHGYEPEMPGDYKVCGECCHIWRTEQAFREDEATVRNAFAKHPPLYCHWHDHFKWCEHNGGVMGPTGWEGPPLITPEDVNPAKVYSCPLCTHDF